MSSIRRHGGIRGAAIVTLTGKEGACSPMSGVGNVVKLIG